MILDHVEAKYEEKVHVEKQNHSPLYVRKQQKATVQAAEFHPNTKRHTQVFQPILKSKVSTGLSNQRD